MATKKQKRIAGEARALAQAEESRKSGLAAQAGDHERRAQKQREMQAKKDKEVAAKNQAEAAERIKSMVSA